jgi:hypothetical protein
VPVAWNVGRRRSRWAKTSVTFGPVGRVLWTVVAAVPLAVGVIGLLRFPGPRGGAIWLIAMALWSVLVMPWILRDIWKATWLPAPDEGRARRAADLSNLKWPGAD